MCVHALLQDRAMDDVLAMRASIKQAKMEIDRLSALFDPSGLQVG